MNKTIYFGFNSFNIQVYFGCAETITNVKNVKQFVFYNLLFIIDY